MKLSFSNIRLLLSSYNININTILNIYNNNEISNYKNIMVLKNKNLYKNMTNIYSNNKFLQSSKILNSCLINSKKIYNNFH